MPGFLPLRDPWHNMPVDALQRLGESQMIQAVDKSSTDVTLRMRVTDAH